MTLTANETLSDRLTLRLSPAMRSRWALAAKATGRTLPELIRAGAELEVEYSEQAAALRRELSERRAR